MGIGFAGLFVASAAMPNIWQIFPRDLFKKDHPKKSLNKSLANLKCKGFVRFAQGPYGWRVELTDRGQVELAAYEFGQKILHPPKKWKKEWHLLVFDILEKKRHIREKIRRALVSFGFYRLQDSVWVYPHECEEVLELLRTKYGVRYEALYIRAEYIAKDQHLRQHFKLT
ncbi:MAG: CRISPR-associated endonuclease Cas2 [Patescibacteria group bacterium]